MGPGFEGNPSAVNDPMTDDERPVPFSNMVYLGDGPSDVPCMSLLQSKGGYVLGVLSTSNPAKAWALGYGRRANVTIPPDFSRDGLAYEHLRETVWRKATEIAARASGSGPVPQH